LFGEISDSPSTWIWGALIVGGISGGLTYGTVTSRIITSPEGIESVSFGIRIKATWDEVERVDVNPYGFVNLVFKESLYRNKLWNAMLRPLAYDRTIQLSPYLEDLATSTLLEDIAKYVPNSNHPEFVVEKRHFKLKPHYKVGSIGLYYLGWFMASVPFSLMFRKAAEQLGALGVSSATFVSYLVTTSLMIGLLLNGLGLLGYNAEINNLAESQIAHKARTHYLSPLVVMLLGLLVSLGIWALLRARSLVVTDDGLATFALVAFLVAAISPRISGRIERYVFRSNVQ
jgi:hypothetical protein